MRDVRGRVRSRVRRCGGENDEWQRREGAYVFSKKAGRKKKKEGAFRKKVHKFLFNLSLFSKNEIFFSRKIRLFETKVLLLHLIKHNFPFIPPHCGVHIAQSRGTFSDAPAQTLFDLLNHRDFALSLPYPNSLQRRCPSPSGDICTTATRPLGLVRKEGGTKACFSSTRKEHSPSLDKALWASPFGSCPAPMRRILPSWFDFRGACFFEKESPKSYSKGLRGGFFCRFEVYRTAINSIITTSHHKNKRYTLHSGSKNPARAFLPIFCRVKHLQDSNNYLYLHINLLKREG